MNEGTGRMVAVHEGDVKSEQRAEGIRIWRLWRAGPGRDAPRALVVEFAAGATWPEVDVHAPGSEEVYVVSGTFEGLTHPGSRHGPGTFLHFEAGTEHRPTSPTGGRLFVFYPRG